MSETIADLMHTWYSQQLGHDGDLIELEREYFGASAQMTWADAALVFYAGANGSNPVGSLLDEAYKYYAGLSGLTPPEEYSLADHIYHTFASGAGHSPIPLANLVAWYEASDLFDSQFNPNLLTPNQQSLETDMIGWITSGFNCTISRDTSVALSGTASLKSVATAASQFNVDTTGARTPAIPGNTYTFQGMVRAANNSGLIRATIQWYNAAGVSLSYSHGTDITAVTTGWSLASVTAVAPANTASYHVLFLGNAPQLAGQVLNYDQMGTWEGVSLEWRDENGLPADGTPVDVWADKSVDAKQYNLVSVSQASFEGGDISGWSGQGNTTIAASTLKAADGTYSLLQTATVNGGGVACMRNTIPFMVPVIPGKTYTASAFVLQGAGIARQFSVALEWYSAAGGYMSGVASAGILADPVTWKEAFITYNAPAGAGYVRTYVQYISALAGESNYIDKVQITVGTKEPWKIPSGSAAVAYNLTQPTATKRPLFRNANPNLLTYSQANCSSLEGLTGAQCTMTVDTTQSVSGGSSVKATVNSAGNYPAIHSLFNAQAVPVVAGKTYTASVKVKVSQPAQMQMLIYWFDAAGNPTTTPTNSGGTYGPNTVGAWDTETVTAVAPAGAALAAVRCAWIEGTPASSVPGDVFFVDEFILREGGSTEWLSPVTLPNDEPVVQFGGVDDFLAYLGTPPAGPYTIYVIYYSPVPNGPYIFSIGNANGIALQINAVSMLAPIYRTVQAFGAPGVDSGSYNVIAMTAPSGISKPSIHANGINISVNGTDSAFTPATGGMALGAGDLGVLATSFIQGNIADCLMYNTIHNDSQRKTIEDYLMNKYGVSVTTLQPLTN